MSNYTPTTEMVKVRYAIGHGGLSDDMEDVRAEAFDRWLAAHDRQVQAEAFAGLVRDLEALTRQEGGGVSCGGPSIRDSGCAAGSLAQQVIDVLDKHLTEKGSDDDRL